MPKILPTCKDGFELNRENDGCKCTRKVIKIKKQKSKTRVKPRKTVKPSMSKSNHLHQRSRTVSRNKSQKRTRNHISKFNQYVRKMKRIKQPRIAAAKNKLSRDNKTSTTSKTISRSIKTSNQLLQAQKNYEELGIKEGDWMMDPCYILRNIKKK